MARAMRGVNELEQGLPPSSAGGWWLGGGGPKTRGSGQGPRCCGGESRADSEVGWLWGAGRVAGRLVDGARGPW